MNIVGVIVEYNPLHNGHKYHIEQIKEKENPDLIIGIMSSSFTNRGDLSIFDKFIKTFHALELGIDLIIELPLIYSMERADIFALKSINILNEIGVNKIYIGSEENNILLYEKAYNLLNENDNLIKKYISDGYSYKESISKIINLKPNDMLGYSYYKIIKDNNYNIDLKTIKRKESNFNDLIPSNNYIASAYSIRSNLELLNDYCPSFVLKDKNKILDQNKIFKYLKYEILSKTNNELKEIFFVDEGLENKLHQIINYDSLDSFISFLATKRYTKTRIKRMLMYILLNVKKIDAENALNENIIRILGFNEKGKNYLNNIKKNIIYYTNIKQGLSNTLDIEFKSSLILDSIFDLNLIFQEQKGPIYKK